MAILIYQFVEPVRATDGTLWEASVYGQPFGNTWEGWLEFNNPVLGTMRTGRETTQADAGDLTYWATGLEPTYLEGAINRAERLAAHVG
jgi:hypothetical protein